MAISDFLGRNKLANAALMMRHIGMWVMPQPGTYVNPNFKAPALAKGIAIYCVHGTADRPSSFRLIAERILHRLPAAISSIHFASFDHRARGASIEFFAEELKNQILANHDQHVILLGHSRGGVVAAYFAEYLAKEAGIAVESVCAIGSPFQGAAVAMWPLTKLSMSVNEMTLNSVFLENLSQKIDHSAVKYSYFAAKCDPLVSPDSAFRGLNKQYHVLFDKDNDVCIVDAPQPVEHQDEFPSLVLLDFHDHLSVMSSHRLVNYLERFIGDAVDRLIPSIKETEQMQVTDTPRLK